MDINLESQKLPPIYKRNGKECYLDPIREKLIYITPEETVRQKVIAYLLDVINVPREMILVEEPLSHYDPDSKYRADIIVNGLSGDTMIPLAIIECKAPEIFLDDFTFDQLNSYCEIAGCNYAAMVNGYEAFIFYYDEEKNTYIQLDSIPSYEDLRQNQYDTYTPPESPPRLCYKDIPAFLENSYESVCEDISDQTDPPIACAGLNLCAGLMDTSHKFPERSFQLFRVLKDYGVRILSYGDASGGLFGGPYRSLLLDVNGSTEFVSFGFSTYGNYTHPDVIKTALNVAIDTDSSSHHALQYVLDDNITYTGNHFHFYHHGRIGIGKIGSGKVSELQAFVQTRYPKIISGKHFYLGSLCYDRNWDLDDPEVVQLLENMISYALIRDEYRNYVKQKAMK